MSTIINHKHIVWSAYGLIDRHLPLSFLALASFHRFQEVFTNVQNINLSPHL